MSVEDDASYVETSISDRGIPEIAEVAGLLQHEIATRDYVPGWLKEAYSLVRKAAIISAPTGDQFPDEVYDLAIESLYRSYVEDQTPAPTTAWERDLSDTRVVHTSYGGHRLTIRPVDGYEFEGLVDGVIRSPGTNVFHIVKDELFAFVNRLNSGCSVIWTVTNLTETPRTAECSPEIPTWT
jgi:hypothetical protein